MVDDGSRGGLSPYYPSEVPSLRGNGRRWVALLLLAVVLFGTVVGFLLAITPA